MSLLVIVKLLKGIKIGTYKFEIFAIRTDREQIMMALLLSHSMEGPGFVPVQQPCKDPSPEKHEPQTCM
jgi:hypothetical protein